MTTVLKNVTWQFDAMDSLFFRDSRPMTAGESAWIESVFPPTGRTLQGAIRTAILDYLKVDYENYKKDTQLKQEIGDHQSIGTLKLAGPWLQKDQTIYYPVPLDLVKNKQKNYGLLTPSVTGIESDIGYVAMSQIKGIGYKTIENKYISQQAMQALLDGKVDNSLKNQFINCIADDPLDFEENALADREPKVGLARDNQTRTAREGMLFAIAPIRLRQEVSIVININGLTEDRYPTSSFLQRLGGEGKLSHVNVLESIQHPLASVNETE